MTTAPADRAAAEFSRLASTSRLGADPMVYQLAATAEERAALARRFALVSLDRFTAAVELARHGRDIRLAAAIVADVVQLCGVTLEPFASRIEDRATLLYRRKPPPEDLAAEDDAYEILGSDEIDIGEAVAQQLSLALPPFPRAPGAEVPPAEIPSGEIPRDEAFGGEIAVAAQSTPDQSVVPSPFAELAKLAKK
jgi:uncharacterized metal-binding protein YceD (DUF177 family)